MGAAFTVAALICWLAGQGLATEVLLSVLLVPAALEAGFGYCVGCQIFGVGLRAGLIPERICLECADIYSTSAASRRHANSAA